MPPERIGEAAGARDRRGDRGDEDDRRAEAHEHPERVHGPAGNEPSRRRRWRERSLELDGARPRPRRMTRPIAVVTRTTSPMPTKRLRGSVFPAHEPRRRGSPPSRGPCRRAWRARARRRGPPTAATAQVDVAEVARREDERQAQHDQEEVGDERQGGHRDRDLVELGPPDEPDEGHAEDDADPDHPVPRLAR